MSGRPAGYDTAMSESTGENENQSTGGDDQSEEGRITDEQLPDDLDPEKNPLAAEPDDSEDSSGAAPGGPGGPGGEGADLGADMGQPG